MGKHHSGGGSAPLETTGVKVLAARERSEEAAREKQRRNYLRYTDERFGSVKAFEKFLRTGHALKHDYVIVDDVLYTMHEYDRAGHEITWANKKHGLLMTVETSDRYGATGYRDAKVYAYQTSLLRNDITYAE